MRVYAVEINGVLAERTESWFPLDPIPERVALLRAIKDRGDTIIIHTSLVNTHSGLGNVFRWLGINDVPYSDVWVQNGKPRADAYLETWQDLERAATDAES